MTHYPGHLIASVAALGVTLAISGFTTNRLIKRKLRLSVVLLAAYVLLHAVLAVRPELISGAEGNLRSLEQLALAAALINVVVIALINPFRADRVPDAFPSIVQDAIVIGLLLLMATFVFDEKLLTTSAVGAVVVGFALQDTLGNAFAGLALQSEKPFRIGDWIRVGDFEGRVLEVTWRATKLRTKGGNFVIVPNNIVAKDAITNYSQPALPTRLEVEVGASYLAAPNDVKAAIRDALAQAPRVLETPPADVVLVNFDASAITYRARFWVEDYERDEGARDEVRTAIYYSFARNGIEIPFPIQVEYSREWPEPDRATRQEERQRVLEGIDLFTRLSDAQRREIAESSVVRTFGNGEAIVREGMPGHSMFIVCSGRVSVVVGSERREVATIEKGGYFGEMSLLTGEPRTATVIARGDTLVMELDVDVLRKLGAADPLAVEQIGLAAVARRAELEQVRDQTRAAAVAEAPATFLSRMKQFLRLR